MKPVLTPEQMHTIDKSASYDYFIPSQILMENAGLAVCDEIIKSYFKGSKIAIIAGRGNNGGDGLVVARKLFHRGFDVKVYMLCPVEDLTADATGNYNALVALNIPCQLIQKLNTTVKIEWQNADLIVDAIFGTGCNREVSGLYADAIHTINLCDTTVYSVDIPSGINGLNGNVMGCAVKADKTIVLESYKIGNLVGYAAEYSGKTVLCDIEIPQKAFAGIKSEVFLLNQECFKDFPADKPMAHKGAKGSALIIAGSQKSGGALILSAEAAYRAGAGLVFAYTTENNRSPYLSRLPEGLINTYCDKGSDVDKTAFYKEIEEKDVILIGPGLSTSATAVELLEMALSSKLPMVIDADALNLMAENPKQLHLCAEKSVFKVMTPHLKEMERLTGINVYKIQENIVEVATTYAKKWNAVLILKNNRTVIAFPSGKCYINILGNEGMATGGSGDVLSGYLTGLIAGAKPSEYEKAVLYGVYHHSLAGDKALYDKGKLAMLASDIINNL